MNAVGVILRQVDRGWVVALTDGREVVRFSGPGAKSRAIRYIARQGFSHAR
jgi:hypothetical protein